MLSATVGCQGLSGDSGGQRQSQPAVTGTIRISGSGTCLPLLKVLEPEFRKRNPSIRVAFLPGVHSSGGIKGVANGTLDVGSVSRQLKPDERKHGLVYLCLSDDALAVAAHAEMNVSRVTSAQLREVYSGAITNWKQLGGPNLAITVLDRNEDESAKIIFRQYVLGSKLKIARDAVNLYYESDMVEGLLNTPGAIGYLSYGFARARKLNIKILALDGVTPSIAHVRDGSYRMVRDLGIVYKPKPPPAAKRFIDFVGSKEAAKVMARHGFAPCRGK